ncbi:MAG: thioredoxin domain-containing protein [bacterium]|nr:thioredoxin domain-containing protein [bacterium]
MKKVLLFIIPIFLLFGCTNSKPFYLDDEFYNSNEITDITSEEFKKYINDKKSFAIFIYTEGCFSCFDFKKVLDEFQEKYNIRLYAMNASEMKKTEIYNYVKYSPSIILYNKGDMVSYLDAESNDDKEYYESTEGLYKWFTKYIILNTKIATSE